MRIFYTILIGKTIALLFFYNLSCAILDFDSFGGFVV